MIREPLSLIATAWPNSSPSLPSVAGVGVPPTAGSVSAAVAVVAVAQAPLGLAKTNAAPFQVFFAVVPVPPPQGVVYVPGAPATRKSPVLLSATLAPSSRQSIPS